MKKILAFFLFVLLCFTLCACGAKKAPTKEEMLSSAVEVNASDIKNDSSENIVGAKGKYCNKTLLLSGYVRNIKEDHIELSSDYGANYMIDVYLSTEELALLQSEQLITVVGNTTDEIVETTENTGGISFDYSHYQMPVAYLVKDRVEVIGILGGINSSFSPAYNIKVGSSDKSDLIFFADDVDTTKLKLGQEIKFSAKATAGSVFYTYYDAEIIE